MKRQNRNYSISFKQKAVELSYSRGHVKQVCEENEILKKAVRIFSKSDKRNLGL